MGVIHSLSLAITSACLCRSSFTAFTLPWAAAWWRGVSQDESFIFTLPPGGREEREREGGGREERGKEGRREEREREERGKEGGREEREREERGREGGREGREGGEGGEGGRERTETTTGTYTQK